MGLEVSDGYKTLKNVFFGVLPVYVKIKNLEKTFFSKEVATLKKHVSAHNTFCLVVEYMDL